MKRISLFLLFVICLSCCSCGQDITPKYPRLEYRNSSYNFDPYNRELNIPDGYILDEGHSYDIVEKDSGYDVVLHFVNKEKER